jgi:hypothetical protein
LPGLRASHPTLVGLFRDAALTLDQIAAAVRIDPEHEAQLAQMAPYATVAQVRKLVRSARAWHPAEPESASTTVLNDRDRGVLEVRARVLGEEGRIVEQALVEARDALFQAGQRDATWTDALVEMAQRSLDAVVGSARRDRLRVHVHVNADPAVDGTVDTATWADGQAMPDAVRDLILCDGVVVPEWWRNGKPYAQGRATRVVPEWMRHHIVHRDRGCRVPGCSAERFVDIHHIAHWGPPIQGHTEPANLVSLCRHHHRMHHTGDLLISGTPERPDGLTFTNARGRPIGTRPPPPPNDPPPEPVGTYRPPTGERLHVDRVYWHAAGEPFTGYHQRAG